MHHDQGGLDDALTEYRKCLAIQEARLGLDHPSAAAFSFYGNIGSVLQGKGDLDSALTELRKGLAIFEATLRSALI